jgi:NitT/TauT family transport system ATP-binding protein
MVFRIFALFPWLDVPTTETLGNDLLDLWLERQIPTRAIVMVSHSIEEALLLADRVVILDSNPDRIKRDPRVARAIRGTATATPRSLLIAWCLRISTSRMTPSMGLSVPK